MKVQDFDGTRELLILEAMIFDKVSLGTISTVWEWEHSFKSNAASVIGNQCVDYYKEHTDAPGEKGVIALCAAWADTFPDDSTTKLVTNLVRDIITRHDVNAEINSGQIIDLARDLFSEIRYEKTLLKAEGYKKKGKLVEAFQCLANLHPVEVGTGSACHLLTDEQAVREVFNHPREESFIQYEEGLEKFFGNIWRRGGFVAFVAAEGVGKSWWLMDVAYRALRQRHKTIYFETGDLLEREIKERILVRVARHPLTPRTIKYPLSIGEEQFDAEEQVYENHLDGNIAWKACRKLMRKDVKSNDSYLCVENYPNSSINVEGIKARLDSHIRQGWIPEVVVVDYADILAPPDASQRWDIRDQVNATWKQLRQVAQKYHCLVVTATQVNRQGYDVDVIKLKHTSEDKRKQAHVDGFIGINQTEEEKDLGIMRLNLLKGRHMKHNRSQCVRVAGCLDIANPAITSWFAGWGSGKPKPKPTRRGTPSRNGRHEDD